MTAVSVIVPARNAASTIASQLEALAGQTFTGRWEIVVVLDAASVDGTASVVADWAERLPQLRVVDGGQAGGRSQTRNRGAGEAEGELLLFCDADDVVAPCWVAAMVEGASRSDLVGGYVDLARLNPRSARRGRRPSPSDRLPVPFGFLPYATSANFGIRAPLLRALGGWNESYDRSGDAELCWRAQLAGHRLSFVPRGIVHYRYRSTTTGALRQQFGWGMADPRLYRDFRAHGLRRRPWWRVVASWAVVVLTVPRLAGGPSRRSAWLQRASLLCGRIVGSIRHRCLFP